MFRTFLIFLVGLLGGAALMLVWWPHPPHGVSVPASSDIRVFISNAYLGRTVQRRASSLSVVSLSGVQVTSNPPVSLIMHADLSIGPVSAPGTFEVEPVANNGKVQVQLLTSDVAGFAVPPELVGLVTNAINQRLTTVTGRGGRVTAVRVLPSGLEIRLDYP